MSANLKFFRLVAFLEGLSFLILVFVCMPIKYWGMNPYPVKIVGMAHGVLVVVYVLALMLVRSSDQWSLKKCVIAFASSLLPFGTFWFDARYIKPDIDAK